jgi:hypothetical protein
MTTIRARGENGHEEREAAPDHASVDRRATAYHLSDTQIQMARELGMNPEKLGKLDNHDQEPWKIAAQGVHPASVSQAVRSTP